MRTKNLRRAPFYILSVGNALLMMAVVILNDFCDSSYSCLHTFTKVLPTPWLRTLHILITGMMEGVMSNILTTVLFLGNTFVFQVDYLRGLITLESLVVLCLVI